MNEKNTVSLSEEDVYRKFMGWPVFLCLAISVAAMYLGVLPKGIIGGMCLLLPLGLILEKIGARIPILKDYLGGSPLLLIFLGAGLVYYKVIPEAGVKTLQSFMKDTGADFLNFYICGLIACAILGINAKLLVKAGLRYAVPLAGCVLASCAMVAVVGPLLGYNWKDSICNIGLPILGGGMGGGAVPMAQVVEKQTGRDMKEVLSIFVPAVVLGNVLSIIAAALLDRLGKKFPRLSGNGEIMRDSGITNVEPRVDMSLWNIAIGMAVSTGFFALGNVFNLLVPDVHGLVFMILAVSILKVAGVVPEYIIVACYSWFRFVVKAFTCIVLLAIGIVFTDMGELIRAVTPTYIVLCASVVVAAILGAGFCGVLVGFNFVESAITAGLCMTNMGGTGDVAVLSAAKRMGLMPFARFSTSIGGGFIIILCGVLTKVFYGA
jgi:Na+/citrate or Na+/malate symporter